LTANPFSTDEQKLKWKHALKSACINLLQKRITTAQQAMQQAQESANSEDKSSAGDKHETARAMSQLERDMHAKQLQEAKRDLQLIDNLKTDVLSNKAGPGAFVLCDELSFFISLGLGSATIEGRKVILLSPNAPLANVLDKKNKNDSFQFNGKEVKIHDVF
jgi:hypothetical protein